MRSLPLCPSLLLIVALEIFLSSCSTEPETTAHFTAFPEMNLIEVKVVQKHLLGKSFMPGGTLARYSSDGTQYEMFASRLPTQTDAAILLAHWDMTIKKPKLMPSLDAYYGPDSGRSIFVFAKGHWIAGVCGLPEKEADLQARLLADRL